VGRKKLDKIPVPSYRVRPETIAALQEIAVQMGYTYGQGAAMGEFLDHMALLDRDLLKLVFAKSFPD
jgi:hypothetical protein